MPHKLRLTAISSSRRILTLEFIRRYFREHGASPSFAEIGAAIGVPVQRVSAIVRKLAAAGEVLHTPGTSRGLRLPDRTDELSDTEVELILLRRGWTVNAVTKTQLTPAPDIDHLLFRIDGDGDGAAEKGEGRQG